MFTNFVSLGSECYVAASMLKYGLRGWSGPFDWINTKKLEWILYYIENSFKNFFEKDQLEYLTNNHDTFVNKESGFVFIHEGVCSLEMGYDEFRNKYERRIHRFMMEIKKPTCFLRLCTNDEEVEYIAKNAEYITNVIKKMNFENQIIFFIKDTIKITSSISFQHYIIPVWYTDTYGPSHEQLRGIFDSEKEFLMYCAANYNAETLMRNIFFNYKREALYQQNACRYLSLMKLWNCIDIKLPSEIIIYGAGNTGRIFLDKIKGKCAVRCFIDKEKAGEEIEGILVCKLEDIKESGKLCFVITATYDFSNIYKNIKQKFPESKILSIEDVCV